ncbi:MAG: DUF3383 domain-containing protein [Proteobacteria bacterium]|nr:DUF3383 domain-containing protein [Pseudomonadota bacterium]
MSSIPMKQIVSVIPGVLSAGGNALDMLGLLLTDSNRAPYGQVVSFASADDVGDYFGPNSAEKGLATIYFNGFVNANIRPEAIRFTQYPTAEVPGWMRGGSLLGMTLNQLKALAVGTITLEINGQDAVAASVDLSSATSFSNAATIIQTAFAATTASSTAGTISGTTLTIGGTITGAFGPGMTIAGTGITGAPYIVAQLTGPDGGAGTYQISSAQTVGSPVTITGGMFPTVTYDSISGAFKFATKVAGDGQSVSVAAASTLSTSLKLTDTTGAVASPGADAATPEAFMDMIVDQNTDWATFMTTFDPDSVGVNDNKLAFAKWTNDAGNEYAYVCWDTDDSPAVSDPAPTSLGDLLAALNYSGTVVIGSDVVNEVTASHAAFFCGAAASIDFTQLNGRITFAFKKQTGMADTCTSASAAQNLIANGYNFFGAYATRNDLFKWFYPGSVSGPFKWADSYINQIWLNNQLQLALAVLLDQTKSIPYNRAGYALITAAVQDPINQAVLNGVIRPGVTLSEQQAALVNSAAGVRISDVLQERGWYFQVRDALPQVRAERGSPPCTLWYMDGGSVQKINLFSQLVQ